MSITLPPLPYAYNALEPHISQRTVEIHHDKHHAKYVDRTNEIVEGMYLEKADLVTIIRSKHELEWHVQKLLHLISF